MYCSLHERCGHGQRRSCPFCGPYCAVETCGNNAAPFGKYCRDHAPRAQDIEGTIRPNYYRVLVLTAEFGEVEIECFAVIDALGLDFYTGNALKYLWRAGSASKVEDLKKIRTYIEQALARAEKEDT